MSEYGWIAGGLFMTFFLLIIFSNLAVYNSSIVCPQSAQSIQEGLTGSGSNVITQISTIASVLFSPCSGLDWWIYLLIFVPIGFAVIVFVTPFIGS